jgi:hypothetical protein
MKTTKRKMTVLAIVIVVAAMLLLPNWQTDAAAFRGEFRGEGNWCDLRGSWYGNAVLYEGTLDIPVTYMIQYLGSRANKGSYVLQWIEFPFPVSDFYGVWVRTGWNTFNFTSQGYTFDGPPGGTSNIVTFARESGTITLLDCNTMEIETYDEPEHLYPPNIDPIEDGRSCVHPTTNFILPARRILLEEHCEE